MHIRRCNDTTIQRFAIRGLAYTQTRRHAYTRTRRHVNTQTRRYAVRQIHRQAALSQPKQARLQAVARTTQVCTVTHTRYAHKQDTLHTANTRLGAYASAACRQRAQRPAHALAAVCAFPDAQTRSAIYAHLRSRRNMRGAIRTCVRIGGLRVYAQTHTEKLRKNCALRATVDFRDCGTLPSHYAPQLRLTTIDMRDWQ